MSFDLSVSTLVLSLFRVRLVVFRPCAFCFLHLSLFPLCSVVGSIPQGATPFRFQKIVHAQGVVPFSTFRRSKRRKGKFGASECASTSAGFTFIVRLVRLGCLFRICRVQNESSVVLWAACRLIPSGVRAVCSESGSGLLGLFYC